LIGYEKPFGRKTTFEIHRQSLEMLLAERQAEQGAKQSSHKPGKEFPQESYQRYFKAWLTAMTSGLMTGRAFSKRTVDDYKFYVEGFLAKGLQVSIEALKAELLEIPVEQVAKRQHLYKALVCFGKFLVSEKALSPDFIEQAKPFYPKRHLPPKRSTIDEAGLKSLLAVCQEPQDKLVVVLLANTGLRATEACQLQWQDIDLEKSSLTIQKGKGGKRRIIGLSAMARESVIAYRESVDKARPDAYVLLDRLGRSMTRNGLYQRLERLGQLAKVKVSLHALRRAFVTINANKGRPLQMLQMACGHSDIKTTMGYCRTSEQEVIEAMKGW